MKKSKLDRQRTAAVRAILLGKRDRPVLSDVAYRVYLTVLVLLVVVFPVVRALVLLLSVPEMLGPLVDFADAQYLAVIFVGLTLLTVVFGGVRGPVVPPQPYIDIVVASPLDRSIALRRQGRVSTVLVVSLTILIAGLSLGFRAAAAPVDGAGALVFLVAAGCGGVQLATFWLIGQLGVPMRRRFLTVLSALLLAFAGLLWVPDGFLVARWLGPWGWVVVAWDATGEGINSRSVIAVVLLAVGACIATVLQGRLLGRLRFEDLVFQSQRWDAVTALAFTYDLSGSATRFKASPRWGRNWSPRFSSNPVSAVVKRDIIAIGRFRSRALLWATISLGLGGMFTYVMSSQDTLLLAFIVPLIAYFSVGGWAEGLRSHASTLGASTPFGLSARGGTLSHLLAPSVVSASLFMLGAGGSVALGAGSLSVLSVLWLLLLILFSAVLQAFSALKGQMPIALRTPIPTPLGDFSLVTMTLWLGDAAIIAFIIGGWLTAQASMSVDLATIGMLGGSIALVALWADARLRKLERPSE